MVMYKFKKGDKIVFRNSEREVGRKTYTVRWSDGKYVTLIERDEAFESNFFWPFTEQQDIRIGSKVFLPETSEVDIVGLTKETPYTVKKVGGGVLELKEYPHTVYEHLFKLVGETSKKEPPTPPSFKKLPLPYVSCGDAEWG
jgi:signal peptidase I